MNRLLRKSLLVLLGMLIFAASGCSNQDSKHEEDYSEHQTKEVVTDLTTEGLKSEEESTVDVKSIWKKNQFSAKELAWIRKELGVRAELYARRADIVEGVNKVYSNVDFSSMNLSIDEDDVSWLVPTSKLTNDASYSYETYDAEKPEEEYSVCISIHSTDWFGKDEELDESIRQSEALKERLDSISQSNRTARGFLVVDFSVENLSDNSHMYCVYPQVDDMMGRTGRYSIVEPCGEMIDFEYNGADRGEGKKEWMIGLQPHEPVRIKALFIMMDNTFGVTAGDYYFRVGTGSNMYMDDEGNWCPNVKNDYLYLKLK